MEGKKLLGAQVSPDLHALAHLQARLEGTTVNQWLPAVIEQHISPQARDLFYAHRAPIAEQSP